MDYGGGLRKRYFKSSIKVVSGRAIDGITSVLVLSCPE